MDVFEEEREVILLGVSDSISNLFLEDLEKFSELMITTQLILHQLHLLSYQSKTILHLRR